MQPSRPLIWSLLLLCLGLAGTSLLMWRQQGSNALAAQAQFARVASNNANQIIDRVFRFQYGLKGIQGAILGGDASHLTDDTFRAFRSTQDVTLEFNGARGFGYMKSKPDAAQALGGDVAVPFLETIDDSAPQALRSQLHDPSALHAAAFAWSRQAPTISGPLPPPAQDTAAEAEGRDLLLLLPALPRDSNPSDPQSSEKGWVYVLLNLKAALIDLTPAAEDYRLTITDVTPGRHGGRVFESTPRLPTAGMVRWQSTREVLGRRWLVEAQADPRFAAGLDLLAPATVGWLGAALSALLAGSLYAFLSNRERQSALHRQEAQLAAIVRNTSDAIVSQTPEGQILDWNSAAERIFGVAATDMVGGPWSRLLLSDWDEAEDARLIQSVMGGQAAPPFDTVLRAHDGTPIDVSMSVTALTSPEGQVERISRTIRDNRERKAAEARLRELAQNLEQQVQSRTSELAAATRHLQSVLDGMPSMIGYWDHNLINRFANRAYATWLKAPHDFVVGLHMEAVLGHHAYDAIRAHVEAVLTGEAQSFEQTEPAREGQASRHLQFHYLPDTDGKQVRGFYVLIHDITELTESQQKLAVASQQSEALLKTIQSYAIYSVADHKGLILDVNDAFCRISGYSRQELLGQNHRIVGSGVHPKAFWTEMWRSLVKGQPWRGEICNRAKDGSLYWVDSIIAPFRGADGRIEKYISLRTDITARRLAEERLRAASEGFLERAGQMAGVGGWELDLATGEMVLTRQTRAIFALNDDRRLTLDESLRYFQSPARELLRHAIHDAVRLNKGWDLELPFVNERGEPMWVRTVGGVEHMAVHDDGQPGRLVGALQDVTSRHLTEEALLEAKRHAEAASSAKTEFLANMSHEIRTPLNAVIGMTHLLGESLKNAEQREWLSMIQSAGKSLLAVLNDVLDLSKIEAGELRLESTPFSLRKLLREIEELFTAQANQKGLTFSVHVADQVPDLVQGDPFRIRQVLINLLSNALKFTEQGSVTLQLRVQARQSDAVELRFHITDTGLGMSPDTVNRLFEPFTQADASTTRRFGGTGLGLSIVRRLVTLMGGEVGVHSESGVGSQFWFLLPLALATPDATTQTGPDPLRVTLVGNRADEADRLADLARGLGWQVTWVRMGDEDATPEALRLDHALRPDLILLEHALVDSLWWAAIRQSWQHGTPQQIPPILTYRSPRNLESGAEPPSSETPPGPEGLLLPPWHSVSLYNAALQALHRGGLSGDHLLATSKTDTLGARWLDGLCILVVDDSAINLEVARRVLCAQGAEVATAGNGQEALLYLSQAAKHVDAVLMDVQMPVMDGKEATRRIRQDLGLNALPIIALTAGALLSERQRALDAGMNDFASKPLDPHALIRVIRLHVEQARGQPIWLVPKDTDTTQTPPDAAQPWPDLAGVDMSAVSTHFGQDQRFYRSLLHSLLQEHGPGQVNWLALLDNPATVDALRARLHKLSGSAAVLCAKSVATLAKQGEALLLTAQLDQVPRVLQALADALADLARSASTWMPSDTAPIPSVPAMTPANPAAGLEDWIEALAAQDLQAPDRFESLCPTLRQALPAEAFETLQTAISALDFARALDVLRQHGLQGVAA